jgi:imidazolonepropionase-like amidohydrolase
VTVDGTGKTLLPGLIDSHTHTWGNALRDPSALGVSVLAGTDAPNPGTARGASMHREVELLVKAGLTPVEALRAATSVPARTFSLTDRGRIAPGLLAIPTVGGGSVAGQTPTSRALRHEHRA